MDGKCIVWKTDFGFEEWSLNEMFLDWGSKIDKTRLGICEDIPDDRGHGYMYASHLDERSGTPFPFTSGGRGYRLLWTVAG
jgi:hypothetical protein